MKKIQRKAKQEADNKSPGDKDKDGKDDKQIIKQELSMSPCSSIDQPLNYLGHGDSTPFNTSSSTFYSPDGNYFTQMIT